MTYRPLNPNEYAIVSKTIYEERALDGGFAESIFMAYKARAMALDEPEFVIFQESEVERRARLAEKQQENVIELRNGADLTLPEIAERFENLRKHEKQSTEPKNCFEWFYGDESKLDTRHKRLRVKFFNSPRYRKHMLQPYMEDGVLTELQMNDFQLIGQLIGEFHRKYPGTRQGMISYYEILFGDASGFCYRMAKERDQFHNDPSCRADFLRERNLPENLSIDEIREYLKNKALESGSATIEQIQAWEQK